MPLIGLAAGWVLGVPTLVKARAREALESRFALSADIGDASVGFGGIELRRVRLRGREGGLDVDLGEARAEGSLVGLVTHGASAIERIVVRDVAVTVDLTEAGVSSSFAALHGGGASRGEAGQEAPRSSEAALPSASGPTLEVQGLKARVRDADGALLVLEARRLRKEGPSVEADVERLTVGGDASNAVALRDVSAMLRRGPAGYRLEELAIGSGEVELVDPPTEGQGAGASGAVRSTSERLRRARGLWSVARADGADAPSDGAPGAGLWSRLAPEAVVRVTDVTVRRRAQGSGSALMRGLTGAVTAEGEGAFHLEGSGHTDGSGTLRWDLHAVPAELRGEGTIAFHELPLALVSPLMPELPWYEPERARLDGELVVAAESPARLSFEGSVALRDAAIASPRVAPDPVFDIGLATEVRGHFVPASRRLELDAARIWVGQAEAQLEGAVEWAPDHYLFDLRAVLPSTACSTALSAIPTDLLGGLAGFSWSGRLAGRLVVRVDSRDLPSAVLNIDVFDGCRFETVAAIADLRRFQRPFLHEVIEPDGTIFSMTTGPGTDNWTPIGQLSPFLVQAVIAHEDASFFRHRGFSTGAIRDALVRNLEEGRYVVGASTITMQLAKNLFLHREKTLARKVQEVLLTWWLESALDKAQILELYVNVIEYGPGIYGVRSAAHHYFGREPSDLSVAESVFLSAVLPNPKRFHASYARGGLTDAMKNRMRRQLHHMFDRGRIDREALDDGLAEVDDFHFHADGDPPPPPRELRGRATGVPFVTEEEDVAGDRWEWEGSGEEAPAHTSVAGGFD